MEYDTTSNKMPPAKAVLLIPMSIDYDSYLTNIQAPFVCSPKNTKLLLRNLPSHYAKFQNMQRSFFALYSAFLVLLLWKIYIYIQCL